MDRAGRAASAHLPRRRASDQQSNSKAAWEYRGSGAHLIIRVCMTVGKQFMALSVVIMQIYYSQNLLMSCDTRRVGMTVAVMCEYTKAHVRCFPLLAIVVSLIVASRMLLCHRIYYKMLKHKSILDFDPVKPYQDLLYFVLSVSAVSAFLHFVLELSELFWHPLDADILKHYASILKNSGLGVSPTGYDKYLLDLIHRMASLYVFPSMIFLGFLWQAYDVEDSLLPLTKYFEEDPQRARHALSNVQFLDESVAAQVVKNKKIEKFLSDSKCCKGDNIFTLFVQLCEFYSKSGHTCNLSVHDVFLKYSYVHLISAMWPGRLLLDHRLTDNGSVRFRFWWFAAGILSVVTETLIVALLVKQLWTDAKDIRSGQKEDLAGMVVTLASLTLILYVISSFTKNAIMPYIEALRGAIEDATDGTWSGQPLRV